MSLLEEENGQENQKPLACFVIGINEIDDFTVAYHKMYTTEDTICLVQEFKEPFIHQFKLRSRLLKICFLVTSGEHYKARLMRNVPQHRGYHLF